MEPLSTSMPASELQRQGNAVLAVPKKGRLHEKALKLLEGAGIQYDRPPRVDVAQCSNLPLTIVFLPAADIAKYVGEGNVDMGITGLDVVEETKLAVDVVMNLEFGKCKLCLQAPISSHIENAQELAGKRIVTSFPSIAREFFDKIDSPDKQTSIIFVSGSVEAACSLGLADAVVDLVETGTTMRAAGLEIITDIMTTEAVMIAHATSEHVEMVNRLKMRLKGYMTATKYYMVTYNVERTLLPQVLLITPGKRRPTVSTLDGDTGVAVSALVEKKLASRIMDELEAVGATDILLFDIANSRM